MRYVGQAFELSVTINGDLETLTVDQVLEAFRAAHHRVFEFSKPPEDPVEIVSYRVGVHARVDAFPFEAGHHGDQSGGDAARRQIDLVEGGESIRCRLLTRGEIGTAPLAGAILVEDGTSTIYVPPGWQVRCDAAGNLIAQLEG